jgi:hypothetical protein
MRLVEAALSSERNKVAGHLVTIRELEVRVAELEHERDCKSAPAPTDLDTARARCAVVSERISRGLEERDALLDYILAARPPEAGRARLPGPPYADDAITTRRSVIRKLRIGEKTDPLFCPTCGQSMPGFSSAHLFMGFYDEKDGGGLGELFISLGRSQRSSLAGGGFHCAAKMASLALQHGASAASLIRQMRRDRDNSEGRPYGPDGPIPGPRVASMTDLVGITLEGVLAERAVAVEPKPDAKETP